MGKIVYKVFKHPDHGFKAVKEGFSWPGFFLNFIWALSAQLWLASGILLAIAVGIFFLVRGMTSADVGIPILVGLAVAGITGWNGNTWKTRNLYDRGYALLGRMHARSPQDAAAKVAATGGVIPADMKAARYEPGLLAMPRAFQRLAAMIALTWKAAFRYKLFWVVTALMLVVVIALPILIHDDGTAAGFAQILITYTLGAVTGLLGLCTLWLACGTLARDVEECQMQVVAVKPIPRWQIWLGKWLGLVTINAALLAVAGIAVFCLLQWRAQGLPPRELAKLKNEVLVARGSAKEDNHDADVEKGVDQVFQQRVKQLKEVGANLDDARKRIREEIKAYLQVVPPDGARGWQIHLGSAADRLKGKPLSLRIKFNPPEFNHPDTFHAVFWVGTPQKTDVWRSEIMSLAPDTFHEFTVPPNLFEPNGDLTIVFRNLNEIAMLFPLDEGMEVLYSEGTFGGSFMRGLGIILCWLALLAALGLAASSCLSFPVAAFVCLSLLLMGLSSGTLSGVVQDKTIMGFDEEKSAKGHSPVDVVAVPFFQGALTVIDMVQQFSPIDSLSSGRDVTWTVLGKAIAEVVLFLGGILGLLGIFLFSRRELATAQGTH